MRLHFKDLNLTNKQKQNSEVLVTTKLCHFQKLLSNLPFLFNSSRLSIAGWKLNFAMFVKCKIQRLKEKPFEHKFSLRNHFSPLLVDILKLKSHKLFITEIN